MEKKLNRCNRKTPTPKNRRSLSIVYLGELLWGTKRGTQGNNVIM